NGPPPDLAGFTLRENGRLVPKINVVPLSKTSVPVGVVLAIDVSGSMNTNGKLDQAKAAAKQFVDQKQANDQIALVTFDNQPHVVTPFTNDGATLDAAIGKLTAQGETALWDGVNAGLGLLHARPELQPNMVLLTDGKDTTSAASFDAVRTTAVAAKATVFSIGLAGGEFDEAGISSLAAATGGQYQRASDPRQLTSVYANVGRALQNQYQITYASTVTGPFDLDLSVAGLSASAHGVRPGTVSHSAFPQPTFVKPVAGA